jgi:hypothetical protein
MSIHPIGSVGHNLMRMRGVWHDHVEVFSPDGTPLAEDRLSGTPGAAPFDNLVYVDFDGVNYTQTNVTFRGRPLYLRTFRGRLVEGVLRFGNLGPDDPGHIGVSGGPGILFFLASHLDEGTQNYAEPDCVRLIGTSERTRTTVLYRGGKVVRSMTANGFRLAPDASVRVPWDPRGPDGPVHFQHEDTQVFKVKG